MTEVPIYRTERAVERQIADSRLLLHLTTGPILRSFAGVEVPFGKPPVAAPVADQEVGGSAGSALGDDPTRAGLPGRAAVLHLEHRELEILARIGLDVRQQGTQLDDRLGGLDVKCGIANQHAQGTGAVLDPGHDRVGGL